MFDKKLEELLRQSVVSTLNEKNLLKEKVENKKEKKVIKEAYVAEPTHFDLKTELLSEKAIFEVVSGALLIHTSIFISSNCIFGMRK